MKYYYDSETGLYYLQSRYYDANIGRFINEDIAEFAVMQGDAAEHNLFAYCGNDCVNDCDIIGSASLKSVLSELVPRLIKAAKMLGEYLLETFGMSKNKYSHKKKYNNATKLMSFVNENKTKLKRATGIFGKISFALECISIVLEFYPKMCKNFSRSSFFQVAELLFYGLNIALKELFSKALAWIISKIAWMLWWAKFLIEIALDYILEIVFRKYVYKATTYFANYLDKNKLTIASCFVAFFKSFKKCF